MLNGMGAVLTQVQPVGSSAILLAPMIALVQTHGTAVYSAEALQEVDRIQLQLAEDLQKQFFMLRQPDEEAVRAEKKAFMMDVLQNLNLHMVFPSLNMADRKAPLYGKDNVLPIDNWHP